MSTELHDALAQAADAGRARFDTRNAADVISPATRRVARHRTAVKVGTGLASVIAIGGLLWGVDTFGAARVQTVDPAVPTFAPGETIDAEALLATTTPRLRDEANTAMAALRCDLGEDNPHFHVQNVPGRAIVFADCATEWAPAGLNLTSGDSMISSDAAAGTITYAWVLNNDGDAPVLVDREGIVAVLTTESTREAEEVALSGMDLQATTTWTSDTTEMSVLTSATDIVTLEPGETLRGSTTWKSSEDGDLVARAVAGDEEITPTLHVRIAPSGEPTGTDLLAIVDGHTSARFTGEDVRPSDAWTVEDLAAIAEPRVQGETRDDATAGMVCEFADPATDPRMLAETGTDVVQSTEAWVECDPVWFVGGPVTGTSKERAVASGRGTVIEAEVHHADARPLSLDYGSTFAWLETDPDSNDEDLHVYSHAAVDTSMWTDAGKVAVQLGPDTSYTTTVNGDVDSVRLTEEASLLTVDEYTLSFWARIHDDNPAGKKTYMIQLGESVTFSSVGG